MLVGIPMVVDHIIPLVAGCSSTLENLCLACYRCNEFKGSRTEAPDPHDGYMTHEDTVRCIELMGKEVLPALRED